MRLWRRAFKFGVPIAHPVLVKAGGFQDGNPACFVHRPRVRKRVGGAKKPDDDPLLLSKLFDLTVDALQALGENHRRQ